MGEHEAPAWPRPQFEPGGGDAGLFYVVFGAFDLAVPPSTERYRLSGPAPFPLRRYAEADRPEALAAFRRGLAWQELGADRPALAAAAAAAPEAVVLREEVPDPSTLDHLRDAVGLVAYLLDRGGVAVWDPFMGRWWGADEWFELVFAPDRPEPEAHVALVASSASGPEEGRWLSTRGMRKFGRPDVSVRDVPPELEPAVEELLRRFVVWQALGAVVAEGAPVVVAGLPEGMTCHHAGAVDDPDFQNVRLEVRWPSDPDSGPREKDEPGTE